MEARRNSQSRAALEELFSQKLDLAKSERYVSEGAVGGEV
jgi:hypothetical protein